jgi:hypothetical protein
MLPASVEKPPRQVPIKQKVGGKPTLLLPALLTPSAPVRADDIRLETGQYSTQVGGAQLADRENIRDY